MIAGGASVMIGKTISTLDRVLPVEDPAKLRAILDECRRRPDPADAVDFSEELQTLERLTAMLRDVAKAGQA